MTYKSKRSQITLLLPVWIELLILLTKSLKSQKENKEKIETNIKQTTTKQRNKTRRKETNKPRMISVSVSKQVQNVYEKYCPCQYWVVHFTSNTAYYYIFMSKSKHCSY